MSLLGLVLVEMDGVEEMEWTAGEEEKAEILVPVRCWLGHFVNSC